MMENFTFRFLRMTLYDASQTYASIESNVELITFGLDAVNGVER